MTEWNNDPFDAAANVQPPTRSYFGQMKVQAWFCVLEKGIGKAPFDAAQHKPEQRRTAIRIELVPLEECSLQFTVMRELIAESKAWTGTVLPSIVGAGVTPREINERWVQVELVPTGRTWLNAAGESKDETMPRIVAVYPDRAACLAAWREQGGTPAAPGGNGHGTTAPVDPERATAAAFLKPMWEMAKHDVDTFYKLIATNPVLAKHFKADSPEVEAIAGVPF